MYLVNRDIFSLCKRDSKWLDNGNEIPLTISNKITFLFYIFLTLILHNRTWFCCVFCQKWCFLENGIFIIINFLKHVRVWITKVEMIIATPLLNGASLWLWAFEWLLELEALLEEFLTSKESQTKSWLAPNLAKKSTKLVPSLKVYDNWPLSLKHVLNGSNKTL